MGKSELVSQYILSKIFLLRNQKVIFDFILAELYGVETKVLKRAVRRNKDRFPKDFCFQLTKKEYDNLRSQIGTSSWGGGRYIPFAFTEQGVAMLSSVLNSKRAVQVNIEIMRAFVKMREFLMTHTELAKKLKELELKIESHDESIAAIFEAIKQLLVTPEKPQRRIGY
jgi:phage regulator Rha-like protein